MIRDVALTVEQYDVCWADLDLGEHVYPLRILGHGQTYEERAVLRRRVYQQLEVRGLARGERLKPGLRDALTLLARAPVWVDLHWLSAPGRAEMERAVAARAGEQGLFARLDAASLHLMPCRGTSLPLTIVEQLPAAAAAPGWSISLPKAALTSPPTGMAARGYDTTPATSGRFRQEVRALEAVLAKPRLRGGQIVANARDRIGRRRRSRPLDWFDTEKGRWTVRLRPTADGHEFLVVAPADSRRMATQLTELLDSVVR